MTQSQSRIATVSADPAPERCMAPEGWDSNAAAQSQLGASQSRGGGQELPFLAGATAATQQAQVTKAKGLVERIEAMVLDTTAVLLPGYLHARDALDVDSIGELGGRTLGAVGAVRGGRAAVAQIFGTMPKQSVVGGDPAAELERMAVEQRLPQLDAFIERLEAEAVDTLIPHRFGGNEVGAAGAEIGTRASLPALGRELQRTMSMVMLVNDLRAAIVVEGALEPAKIAGFRRQIEPYAARPIDLAFLKAALGWVWTVLDAEAPRKQLYTGGIGFMPGARPSDLMADATERTKTTGWLGDTGTFDIDTAHMLVMGNDQEGAMFALKRLYSADRASRPKLLEQLDKRGDLDKLCKTLGDDAARALYEDLPPGYPELKAKLSAHFGGGWLISPDDETEKKPGEADVGMLSVLLADADKETSAFAIDELFELPQDQRTKSVVELQKRGLLEPMLKNLGWRPIKDLHDSLSGGYGELKTQLQKHFLGKGKYGPSLDSEWESHESSLSGLVGKIPYAGKALNVGLDFVTFGFNSSYGSARDANTRGETSDAEFARSRNHLAARTALMAAVSLVTAGSADKFLRGAGTGATLAGVGSGMVGGATGLATSDAYNVLISGEQEGFSSFEDYVKAVALGGVVGGVFGKVTESLSPKAARHAELPEGTAPKQLGPGETVTEAPTTTAKGGGAAKATAPETWPSKPGDPAYAKTGPARESHPKELAEVMAEAKKLGVKITEREGALGYQPSTKPGVAGELVLDPDASWSAIMHEMQHLIDDAARGFPGAEVLYQPKVRWEMESAAYGKEISIARRAGDQALIRELEAARLVEWQRIFKPDLVNK